MAESPRITDLESPECLRVQEREWWFHRVGRVALAVFLAAAAAGVLGGGLASRGVAGEKGGTLWVEYDRFARDNAPVELRVHVRSDRVTDGPVKVWVGKELMRALDVEDVLPQPVEVAARGDRYVYTFARQEGEVLVVFAAKGREAGFLDGRVGVEGAGSDGAEVRFWQFLFP